MSFNNIYLKEILCEYVMDSMKRLGEKVWLCFSNVCLYLHTLILFLIYNSCSNNQLYKKGILYIITPYFSTR